MMRQNKVTSQKQSGIALIMVLLVVALVTIIATGIASKQNISTRRTQNLLYSEQGYMYLLGAEDWAKTILVQDSKDNKTDSLDDNWATTLPPIPVEGGTIQGTIEDLQGRFNINNILKASNPDQNNIIIFKNLLIEHDIDDGLVDALVDWLDEDLDSTVPNGAEDGIYLSNVTPSRTANHLMASATELTLVKGFDYKKYNEISEYIVALPEATTININTANAMQLSMLSNQVSLSEAEDIIKNREKSGFKTVDEFLALNSVKGKTISKEVLSVTSNYFLLKARSVIGSLKSELYSVLYRNSKGEVKVLLRSQRRI